MGPVLQENSRNKPGAFERKRQALGQAASKKTTKAHLHPPQNNGISRSPEADSQQRLRRNKTDAMLITTNPLDRQHNTKVRSHLTSRNGQKERRQRQHSGGAKGSEVRESRPRPIREQSEDKSCSSQRRAGDEDDTSDLSDSERFSELPDHISPPDLILRAELIDPDDLRPSRHAPRFSYPDFLPPPFNSWSLGQLAVYLNTDGRAFPRPKPAGPLERFLDRLLQMEWRQIQTLQEESSTSAPKSRHPSSPLSLSSPKCILQCQRGFPLTLLSSLGSQYPVLNGSCRSCVRPVPHSGLPRRSSSESRGESKPRTREHRLSDPLGHSGHWRRMQDAGNIRCPVGPSSLPVASERDGRERRTQRSRSCAGHRVAQGCREQRKSLEEAQHDTKASSVVSSASKLDSNRLNGKQKRVEFVT